MVMLKHVTVEQETATMKPVIVNVTDNTKHIYEPVVFSLTYRSQNNRKLIGGTLYTVVTIANSDSNFFLQL